jgi:hypothetical protein
MRADQIGDVTHTLIREAPPTPAEMDDARVAALRAVDAAGFRWTLVEIIVARHPYGVTGPLFPIWTDEPCWTVAWSAWAREVRS